ncbi:unnamed protein product, partial [Protopolystoma xenopodis]
MLRSLRRCLVRLFVCILATNRLLALPFFLLPLAIGTLSPCCVHRLFSTSSHSELPDLEGLTNGLDANVASGEVLLPPQPNSIDPGLILSNDVVENGKIIYSLGNIEAQMTEGKHLQGKPSIASIRSEIDPLTTQYVSGTEVKPLLPVDTPMQSELVIGAS